ncbi:ran-binding protein 1 homolog b isoform X2 [Rhododendron vialii]|uniref:ran-binding protein 1 homolog b isoform X2 n=1 Tax=Rhododendron vialii TaxID=182163 RepID=UPI00265FB76A|nr:ran-binding protein 1 homolog b isoform X2 [Rhododendron vialii]
MATTDPDHRDAEEATAGEDEDTGAQVTPLVKLQEVAVTTGEEEEDAILDLKAKLYRFDKEGNQWKERGVGTVKLLKHKGNGKVRLVMRQSKTLKICANHLVGPTMSVQEYAGNDKACVWHAADFSDGERKDEFFCIRFGSIDSKAKFAITKNQGLHFKDGEEHTFHQFDYLATAESLAKPLLGLERTPYEAEGHTRMKVNKELLAKLRADRGAILEGELARKKQKLGGEAKGTDDLGVVIFEMPRADEGMNPKEAIDTAAFLSKSAGKKPLNIEEPSIKVDPKESDNRLSNSQADMRKLDELPDKELYEKCLASLGEVYTSLPLFMHNLATCLCII